MRALLLLFLLVPCFAEEKYDTERFKNVDVDAILNNERLVRSYFRCLMGQGTCTPEGDTLKKILPDAIKTGCSKCTERQIKVMQKVVNKLRGDYPDIWTQLLKKYDPNGIYRQKYRNELRKIGFAED